ncbi:MAG: AAA family ATPase [Candidatus Shapirobacteria bacterium]|jgi:2-phosphoglycerate kinase
MVKPKLIVITGAPGTGKTTIAKKISEEFSLPLIIKDKIKESLFDNLGWDIPGWDPDSWQKKIGIGSIELMHYFSRILISKTVSHIIESNFVPKFADQKLTDLRTKYPFSIFQIYVKCDHKVLIDRFKKRVSDPSRHPGHGEETYFDELEEALSTNRFDKLSVFDDIFEIDTTNFDKIDYQELSARLSQFLSINH